MHSEWWSRLSKHHTWQISVWPSFCIYASLLPCSVNLSANLTWLHLRCNENHKKNGTVPFIWSLTGSTKIFLFLFKYMLAGSWLRAVLCFLTFTLIFSLSYWSFLKLCIVTWDGTPDRSKFLTEIYTKKYSHKLQQSNCLNVGYDGDDYSPNSLIA